MSAVDGFDEMREAHLAIEGGEFEQPTDVPERGEGYEPEEGVPPARDPSDVGASEDGRVREIVSQRGKIRDGQSENEQLRAELEAIRAREAQSQHLLGQLAERTEFLRQQEIQRQQQALAWQQQAAQQAAQQQAVEQDPEPDPEEAPFAHLQWQRRQERAEFEGVIGDLRRQIAQVSGTMVQRTGASLAENFRSTVRSLEQDYATQVPDYFDAYSHLEENQRQQLRIVLSGHPQFQNNPQLMEKAVDAGIENRKAEFLVSCLNVNPRTGRPDPALGFRVHPSSALYELAKTTGYQPRGGGGQQIASAEEIAQYQPDAAVTAGHKRSRNGMKHSEQMARLQRAQNGAAMGGSSASASGLPGAMELLSMPMDEFRAFSEAYPDYIAQVMGRDM
jgi:hypothetical protein